MNTHHTNKNPIILINFETAIYKDGTGFLPSSELTRKNTPPPKKKVKLLLKTISKDFRICLYADEHFHEALHWIISNNLHENCIHRLTRRKPKHSFYIAEL